MMYRYDQIALPILFKERQVGTLLELLGKNLHEALGESVVHASEGAESKRFMFFAWRDGRVKVFGMGVDPESICNLHPSGNASGLNDCIGRVRLRDHSESRSTRVEPSEKVLHDGPFMLLLDRPAIHHRSYH